MALTPLTKVQQANIVRNVLAACKSIEKLNRTGYNFLYLANGFIAHCNLGGFKDYYRRPGSLARDILDYYRINQWSNFRPGEPNFEYYMSKRDTYNAIVEGLRG